MIRIGRHIAPTLLLFACVLPGNAQNAFKLPTRFNIGGSFTVSQPKEGLGQNIGTGFGANVGMVYNLMSSGLVGLRFDLSHVQYGHEKKSVPLSETIGSRVLVDVHTNNTITALSLAPELAKPSGFLRPYVNFGYSRLFFRTTSSVGVDDGSEEGSSFSTTNQKDGAGAWVYGGGLRWQLGHKGSPVTLDTGLRYFRGGFAAYLREGSIQDNPDGSLTITPLMSRTPFMVYTVGVKFQIPYDSNKPCARFLC